MTMPLCLQRRSRAPHARRGFSVIEIIVAITTLGIIIAVVGRLSMVVNGYGKLNDLRAKRNFAVQQQADFVGALSYTNLNPTTLPASKVFRSGDFSYARRIKIDSTVGSRRIVTITIVPKTGTASDTLQKDVAVVVRSNATCRTVLNTVC